MAPRTPARSSFPERLLAPSLAALALTLAPRVAAEPSKLPPELGWNYGELETARTAALGGATRAVGPDTTAVLQNPANIVATPVYYLSGFGTVMTEAKRQTYGGIMMDGTRRYGLGVSAAYILQDPEGLKRKGTDARAAFGYQVSDKLAFGVTGKYLKLYQNGLGPFGNSLASGGLQKQTIVSGFSFDAGLTARPTEMLSIAILGTNLTNPGDGFRPAGVGGGIGIGTRDFTIEGDVHADFTTYEKTKLRAMGGAELLAGGHFPIRVGYRWDEFWKAHALSGGVGYIDSGWSADISLRRTISPDNLGSTAIFFGFSYLVDQAVVDRSPGAGGFSVE